MERSFLALAVEKTDLAYECGARKLTIPKIDTHLIYCLPTTSILPPTAASRGGMGGLSASELLPVRHVEAPPKLAHKVNEPP